MLTKEAIAEYIKKGGSSCPYCGEDNVEGDGVDVEAGKAVQEVYCLGCGATWNDTYKLVGVVEVHPPADSGEEEEEEEDD